MTASIRDGLLAARQSRVVVTWTTADAAAAGRTCGVTPPLGAVPGNGCAAASRSPMDANAARAAEECSTVSNAAAADTSSGVAPAGVTRTSG